MTSDLENISAATKAIHLGTQFKIQDKTFVKI
jgi:hypothetical protein